jgi:hypothetical protein
MNPFFGDERDVAMSSAEAARQSRQTRIARDLDQYLEPSLFGQPVQSQDWRNLAQQLDPSSYQEMENADPFGIDIGYEDVSIFDTILGPTDFYVDYYTINEFREVNRSQVLQRTVPVFQLAVTATLHESGVYHFLNVNQYIYTLFRAVCQRRGVDAMGEGYCQIRVEPFENMWNENRTQTYQHGFATTMTPLIDMELAIENILNSIQQSENTLELEDMDGVEIQYYFTFVLTRSSEDITPSVVTEAARLHHLKDRHKITKRGQQLALRRFTLLEQVRAETRGVVGNREQEITPEVLRDIRQVSSQKLRVTRDPEDEIRATRQRRENAREFAQQRQIEEDIDGLQYIQNVLNEPSSRLKRWYASMTPEQRAEKRRQYNRKQRAKNNQVRGIYEEYRKRLFHHTSVEEFFTYSKAILQVPNTYDQGYCLAMAFMRSQCCSVNIATGNVSESKANPHIRSDEELHWTKTVEVLAPYAKSFPRAYPFTKASNEQGYYQEIVLFNPYRNKSDERMDVRGCMRYENEVPAQEALDWYVAAQNFHAYVVHYFRLLYEGKGLGPLQLLRCYANLTIFM